MIRDSVFDRYIDRWRLIADGDPLITRTSRLLPALRDGRPVMLKIAAAPEEKWGAGLMLWWNGIGAAQVIEHDEDAILLERATGNRSLQGMVQEGADDAATRVICDVIAALHAPRTEPAPDLIALSDWFGPLIRAGEGGILGKSAATASLLLADPRDVVVLHGDIHHGNILDFQDRGWLAIDPKRLLGERGFDYANLFCNPNHAVATAPGRLARQVAVVAQAARLDPGRLLRWILAWAGLSAVWHIEDGNRDHAEAAMRVAAIAAAEIGSG